MHVSQSHRVFQVTRDWSGPNLSFTTVPVVLFLMTCCWWEPVMSRTTSTLMDGHQVFSVRLQRFFNGSTYSLYFRFLPVFLFFFCLLHFIQFSHQDPEFYSDHLSGCYWQEDGVWTQCCCCYGLREPELFPEINHQLPVMCSCWGFCWCLMGGGGSGLRGGQCWWFLVLETGIL